MTTPLNNNVIAVPREYIKGAKDNLNDKCEQKIFEAFKDDKKEVYCNYITPTYEAALRALDYQVKYRPGFQGEFPSFKITLPVKK